MLRLSRDWARGMVLAIVSERDWEGERDSNGEENVLVLLERGFVNLLNCASRWGGRRNNWNNKTCQACTMQRWCDSACCFEVDEKAHEDVTVHCFLFCTTFLEKNYSMLVLITHSMWQHFKKIQDLVHCQSLRVQTKLLSITNLSTTLTVHGGSVRY